MAKYTLYRENCQWDLGGSEKLMLSLEINQFTPDFVKFYINDTLGQTSYDVLVHREDLLGFADMIKKLIKEVDDDN